MTDVNTQSVWAAGELLRFGGNFNKYVQSRDLVKQEGIIFRHLLRLILLCGEFAQVTPADVAADAWQPELRDIAAQLTASCRAVDPTSTDEMIEKAPRGGRGRGGNGGGCYRIAISNFSRLTGLSPRPGTPGRGVGVRGDSLTPGFMILHGFWPPHPQPLSPEYRGEGRPLRGREVYLKQRLRPGTRG